MNAHDAISGYAVKLENDHICVIGHDENGDQLELRLEPHDAEIVSHMLHQLFVQYMDAERAEIESENASLRKAEDYWMSKDEDNGDDVAF